ncbi:MAG: YchF/TatD family DNA exonuclease [Candidatus Alcyoniella australis]|nr:YchF/TatD family DNA exonuclease [Candidatus Alcyoniella australis]
MYLIETHAHLDMAQFDEDRTEVIGRAVARGVRRIVSVGIDVASSRAAVELAQRFPAVYAAVGIHPHDAKSADDRALAQIEQLAAHPKVVAIGEIGLDFYRDHSPHDQQRSAFAAQLELAGRLGLPVIIHDRQAHEDVLAILDQHPCLPGVMHCFSGGPQLAQEVISRGLYLSFTGNITFKNADRARRALAAAGPDRLLLETDCPFMAPEPHRGSRNEPCHVELVAATAAKVLDLSLVEVAARTTDNAYELFGFERREAEPRIVYEFKDALYLNITNRCGNRCPWCARQSSYIVGPYLLKLQREPSPVELYAALDNYDVTQYPELVFCGFGEPLMRIDDLLQIARELRRRRARSIRVNTNGWAGLALGRDVVEPLVGLIDEVWVSLNAPDAANYEQLCHPEQGLKAYEALIEFVRRARELLPKVALSAVDYPGADIPGAQRAARDLGLPLHVRHYSQRP